MTALKIIVSALVLFSVVLYVALAIVSLISNFMENYANTRQHRSNLPLLKITLLLTNKEVYRQIFGGEHTFEQRLLSIRRELSPEDLQCVQNVFCNEIHRNSSREIRNVKTLPKKP